MNNKKKVIMLWGSFAVASTTTMAGIFTHLAVFTVGMCMLVGIHMYCVIQLKKK
jgi:hypothetical protein